MRIITYECEECGTEVVVTETGQTSLMPIYCCGLEVTEVSSVPNPAVREKKTAGKTAKKPARSARKATAKSAAKTAKVVKKVAGKSKARPAGTTKRKTVARKPVKK